MEDVLGGYLTVCVDCHRQPDASGGYMSPHFYSQDAPYPSNQSYMQNVVRPAGGNPFE